MKRENAIREAFTLDDKIAFFTVKWKKEHRLENIGIVLLVAVLMAVGLISDNGMHLVGVAASVVVPMIQRKRMKAYVQQAVNDSGKGVA